MATRVTSKGQVTIPKRIRDRLRIRAGSEVEFELADNGAILRTRGKAQPRSSRFERMRGTATSGMTTEEIMALSRGR
jgi:AbrB family looped-hinge helix DNA binding protein